MFYAYRGGSQMVEKQPAEDSFRSSLEDVIAVATKLSPFCTSVEELVKMLEPALDNAAQLRLIMQTVTKR